jgi:putative ABC transport system permease protein
VRLAVFARAGAATRHRKDHIGCNPTFTTMASNLRHAFRRLLASPGFTVAVILTLALGIGANTAVFSLVNATFLRPLPYPEPDRLMLLTERSNSGEMGVSYPNFLDWRAQQDAFSGLALYHPASARLKIAKNTELVSTCLVSGDFFSVLDLHVAQGRGLITADDRVGAEPVTWITHAAWQKYFAGDQGLVGRTVLLDGQAVTLAGILPATFQFHRSIDFFRPIAPYAEQEFMQMRANHNDAYVLGRLKPHVTPASAQAQMAAIAQRLEREYPKEDAGIGANMLPLREHLAGAARTQLLLLLGAVGMVLLITCLNVANMLLSRSLSREKEMAIRTALGASRGQLIRQLLAESLVLAAAGGLAGLLLGLWGNDFARQLVPWEMRSLAESSGGLDPRVLLFVAGATLLTGIGFGLAPAWRLSHANPNDALKNTRRTVRTGFGRIRLGDLLVVGQVALALVLLVGAGLLVRSLHRLLQVPAGIRPERVLTLQVTPPIAQFQRDPFSVTAFYSRIVEKIGTLPEVEAAAAVTGLPFTWNMSTMDFYLDGRTVPEPGKFPNASRHTVSADYFRALGIPMLRGRTFDGHEKQPVIPPGLDFAPQNFEAIYKDVLFDGVISQKMADQFWPGEDPLGKRFRLGWPELHAPWVQVVGIAGNTTQTGQERGESAEFYLSLRQFPTPEGYVIVRTRMDPAAALASIRTAIQSVVKDEPITDVQLMSERMAGFVSDRRFNMNLFGAFAGVALLLSVIGIYGVLSFFVSQRTREVGIRMALGARRADVLFDVLARGLRLAGSGVVLGLGGAWAVSRLLQSQLFGITGTDPLTYIGGALLLLFVALAACVIPARRAASINPTEALRAE